MSKVTITDIAKEAHVSLGTVSNVLNHRGNVKVDTIRKVEQAATKLNYVRDTTALAIRQKNSTQVALVMPRLNDNTNDLYANLYHELKNLGFSLKLFETNNDLQTEENCYNQIRRENYYGIFVINNLIASKKIARQLDEPQNLIFIGATTHSNVRQVLIDLNSIKTNFTDPTFIIKDDFGLGLYHFFAEDNCINDSMNEIYQQINDYPNATFVTFNSKLANRIQSIAKTFNLVTIKVVLITVKNIVSFNPESQKTVFHYSANKIALSLVDMLSISTRTTNIDIYQTNYQTFATKKIDTSLKLLLLETPFSQILKNLLPDLKNKYGIDVDLVTKDFSEMRTLLTSDDWKKYDLIRLDISDFNWFGKKIFKPLTADFGRELTKLNNWQQYIYLEKAPYALPLDPSVQMMLYQTEIFNNAIIQKQYSEKFGRELVPPTTYQELVDFSTFLEETSIPEIKNYHPISLIDDQGVLIASEFLPYYYSLGGQIDYTDKVLKFDSKIFIKTYELYRKLRSVSMIESKNWWNSEVDDFKNQGTALLVGFSNHLNNVDPTKYGIAPIPGNKPALGGGVIGINKYSKKTDTGIIFLKWLYQYQIQHEIALMGGDVPATDLFFEREIYEQFPFLSHSIKLYQTGVRKTTLTTGVNLYTLLFEKLVGTEIKNGIKNNFDATTVLININTSLLQNVEQLISESSSGASNL